MIKPLSKKNLILACFLSMFLVSPCLSQEFDDRPNVNALKANNIHFSPGLLSFTLSYEHKLWHPKNENALFKTFSARLEGGPYKPVSIGDEEGYRPLYIFSVSALTGRGKHHLEVGLGISYMRGASSGVFAATGDKDFAPNIGYRYQKPGGNFIFRFGASNPRYSYISVGFAF